MKILFCGITMAHYTWHNLSPQSKELSKNAFQLTAMLTETLVFGYLGLALFSFGSEYDVGLIICGIIAMILGRVANIFPITYLVNRVRQPERRIPMNQQVFMWFSGLRGAIAFTLSINLPPEIPEKTEMALYTATLVIIFFTIIVQGGFIIPVIEKLNIPMQGFQEINQEPEAHVSDRDSNIFLRIDNHYLRPFFIINYRRHEEPPFEIQDDSEHMELKEVKSRSEDTMNESDSEQTEDLPTSLNTK